ncbi:phage regulatory CII family protein [Methylopila sp. M107]|uniref:phage regulatory CII family protein n=1 Tax=Methylopila sp. M107 TaxID=1101190 RepID=UPI00037FDCC0|nr:phage regulatory CII family protein [Methylopila sp. M107]
MTIARQLSRNEYDALKAATKRLITLVGGLEAAARITRVGHQQLSRYQSREHADQFMPIDIVADLEAEAGEAVVTKVLADLANCNVTSRDEGETEPLGRHLARIAKENADLVAALAIAMSDGKLDDTERATLRAELHAAMDALNRLFGALDGEGAT